MDVPCYNNVYALFLYIGNTNGNLTVGLTDTPPDDSDGYSDSTLCATVSVAKDVKKYLVSCQSSCVSGRYLFIRWKESHKKLRLAEVQVYAGIPSSLLILNIINMIVTQIILSVDCRFTRQRLA